MACPSHPCLYSYLNKRVFEIAQPPGNDRRDYLCRCGSASRFPQLHTCIFPPHSLSLHTYFFPNRDLNSIPAYHVSQRPLSRDIITNNPALIQQTNRGIWRPNAREAPPSKLLDSQPHRRRRLYSTRSGIWKSLRHWGSTYSCLALEH